MIVQIKEHGTGRLLQTLEAVSIHTDGQVLEVHAKPETYLTGAPTSSGTDAQGGTSHAPATSATAAAPGRYVEPDPRDVKCADCPHTASKHSDSGCIQTQVQEREFRTPGSMGYCKCGRTYKLVMAAHKAAALASGYTE